MLFKKKIFCILHIIMCIYPYYLKSSATTSITLKKEINKVLFLGLPNQLFTETNYIKKENKILILDKEAHSNPILQEKLAEYGKVISVNEYYNSAEVTLAALQCFQATPYDRIIALSESDILRAAALRDHLKLEGQHLASAEAFRDKFVMKETLLKNHIKTADFLLLKNELDLIRFIEAYGYPVIVKPRKAYGAIETFVLKEKSDLEDLLKLKGIFDEFQNSKFIVETFIEGEMYHIDGLVYQGKIVFICPSQYTSTCLEMNKKDNSQRKGYSASFALPQKDVLTKQLIYFTQKVLESLPTPPNTAFFLEVFKSNEGEFIVCEIASRVGGYPNPQVLWETFSIDLKQEFIRVQAGLPPSYSWKQSSDKYFGGVAFATMDGVFKGLWGLEAFKNIKEKHVFINEGGEYSMPSGFLSLAAYFIIPAKSSYTFTQQTDELAKWFFSKKCWKFSKSN